MKEAQQSTRASSLSSYTLNPPYFIIQGLKGNKEAQEEIFDNMCNFGAWEEWMSGIRSISSYLYAETKKYQERLLNKIYLDTIKGYIL